MEINELKPVLIGLFWGLVGAFSQVLYNVSIGDALLGSVFGYFVTLYIANKLDA